MSVKTLVLGGARSGKSRYAETLAAGWRGERVYIATGQAGDSEMAHRIAAHRERREAAWRTVEEPYELSSALMMTDSVDRFVLVDCLTLWISNLLLADRDIAAAVAELASNLVDVKARVVIVSNEVGMGIVPDNVLARRFRDEAGWANQRLAEVADEVVFVAAGLPLTLKAARPGRV